MVEAARVLFLENGYEISLDEVASKAGVSKKTLYNHFGTKISLLHAVVSNYSDRFERETAVKDFRSLRDLLLHFAELYQEHSFTMEGIKFYKLIVSDVSRFPEMSAEFYENGIDRVASALTAHLERALGNGQIAPVDTRAAAEQFLGAVTGLVRHRAYAGLGLDGPDVRAAYIAQIVGLFTKALEPEVRPFREDAASA